MNDKDGKGFEKWKAMVVFQIKRLDELIENTLDDARRNLLLERKRRLEHELKIAALSDTNYIVLLKIKKNEEEYEELLERKNTDEFVDDLIEQNRYTAEILAEQDKKNCEESMKELEAEKKRIGKERPGWPVMETAVKTSPPNFTQTLPEANLMTLESLGEEKFFFYDNYKNMVMLQIKHLKSLKQTTTDESRRNILVERVRNLEYELGIVSWVIVYLSNKNKPYDGNFLSKGQERGAQRIINLLVKGLKLKNIPKYKVFGSNITEVEKKIFAHFDVRNIKLVFNFKNQLKKLVYIFDLRPTQKFYAEQNLWTGILDFPISQAFLFGRMAEQTQHGGGTYCFVPFNHEILNIGSFKEEWEEMHSIAEKYIKTEMVKDFISEEIEEFNNLYDSIENTIENYFFLALLNQFRFSSKVIGFMKEGYYKFRSNIASNSPLINQLNRDHKLIKLLKKISHFGNSHRFSYRFMSNCDVSILFFPYQNKTIFQVCDYKSQNKNTIPAMNALINKLMDGR